MTGATDLRDPASAIDLFDRAAGVLRDAPHRRGCSIRLPARGRLLVTGDLHDNPPHLQKILRLADLDRHVDHHVVLHELIHGERLINGMDFSHRMLVRTAGLVVSHPRQVHPLLANHELSQMTGRAVTKGAGNSVDLFNDALEFVYGEAWTDVAAAIGRFIAAMPLALIGGPDGAGVLCAHSLPNARMMGSFDADVLDRDLVDDDLASPLGSAHLMVWGRRHDDEQIESLAGRWGVKLFCLGHQHVETGIECRGPRVIVINSDHERGAALPIDLGAVPDAGTAMVSAAVLAAV